jgi:hypothetical protein
MFGATMSLASAGLADLPRDILVPGVAVFSRRAMPLAAWTNGLEIAGDPGHALRGRGGVNQYPALRLVAPWPHKCHGAALSG